MQHDNVSAKVTEEALGQLESLFATSEASGVEMAVRAAGAGANSPTIAAALTLLVADLLNAV